MSLINLEQFDELVEDYPELAQCYDFTYTPSKSAVLTMLWNESNIILAVVGMVGLFSTAIIWQRSNRITSKYYGKRNTTQE